jgi:hypothetical protein
MRNSISYKRCFFGRGEARKEISIMILLLNFRVIIVDSPFSTWCDIFKEVLIGFCTFKQVKSNRTSGFLSALMTKVAKRRWLRLASFQNHRLKWAISWIVNLASFHNKSHTWDRASLFLLVKCIQNARLFRQTFVSLKSDRTTHNPVLGSKLHFQILFTQTDNFRPNVSWHCTSNDKLFVS